MLDLRDRGRINLTDLCYAQEAEPRTLPLDVRLTREQYDAVYDEATGLPSWTTPLERGEPIRWNGLVISS